jgi:hypothetical protein
MIYVKE